MTHVLTLGASEFTNGRARYSDHLHPTDPSAKIWVKVRLGDLEFPVVAQLDTGSPWSIIEWELLDTIGLLQTAERVGEVPLSTRGGRFTGELLRVPLTLVADDGESLELEATVWASGDWTLGNFLGYNGLLDRIRFAIDARENHFYFGSHSEQPAYA